MSDKAYNWKQFHAYRVFDEFLDRLVLQRRSYVTNHQQVLDLDSALEEIRNRFVDGFDDSKRKFENKVNIQFTDASENTKITFANIEYLWAMPMGNISPKKKRSYALRWFSDSDQVVKGERFFFRHPHAIANPGPWFLRNKYWELIALLRVLREVTTESRLSDLEKVKARIGILGV